MNSQEFTAKTVEEAVKEGLAQMGLTEAQAEIEVLDKGGFLRRARVKITTPDTEGQKALHFVEGLLEKMDIKCTAELTEDEAHANVEIISINSGAVIGHRGDVLDAIQYLASIVANEGKQDFKRIVVDCENYRERRITTLETLAKRMADKAVQNGRKVKLEPMNAFERRIIHAFLTNDDRVATGSFGEEPYRFLTITPKNLKPRSDRKPYNKDRKPYNRDGRPGNRDRNDRGERKFDRRPRNDDRRTDDAPRPKKKTVMDSISNFGAVEFLGNSNDSTKQD